MSKKKIIIAGFLSCCLMTGIWGCSIDTVYESETVHAFVTESDGEKELELQIKAAPSDFPETLKQYMKEKEPVHHFEAELSDGTYYGYQDDTNDKNGGIFPETFSDLKDMEELLDKNLIHSNAIMYPAGKVNFVLSFLPGDNSVSIQAAKSAYKDKISVGETIYMVYGKSEGRFSPRLTGVTDQIYCRELNTSFGEKVLAFIDETADQAGVYLEMDGAVYWWNFEGDFNQEDIISFINTLEE